MLIVEFIFSEHDRLFSRPRKGSVVKPEAHPINLEHEQVSSVALVSIKLVVTSGGLSVPLLAIMIHRAAHEVTSVKPENTAAVSTCRHSSDRLG